MLIAFNTHFIFLLCDLSSTACCLLLTTPTRECSSQRASCMHSWKRAASKKHEGSDVEQQGSPTIQFKRSRVSEKTPQGYRLATFGEVEQHRTELLFSGALKTWDISKLLDGWIDGPGYANQPVREFRPELGTRILINKGDEDEWKQLDEEGKKIAFLFACEVGLEAAEPFLQESCDKIEARQDIAIKCSPLHAAIFGGDFHLCCRLVKRGADVNRALGSEEARHFDAIDRRKVSGLTGATPLHLAIAFGFEKFILEYLLKSTGLDWRVHDGANRTALHYAAISGNVAIFEALLSSQQISLSLADGDGSTVLHIAAAADNSALLDKLLQSKDIPFLALNAAGRSALHLAAATGNVGSVKALIPHMKGAILQADDSGKIPLVYAIESCQPQAISELLKNDRRSFQAMGEVAVGQSISLKTPLHYAVYTTRKKGRIDHKSMLMPLLHYATYRTRDMFDLFWDENAALYHHAKHVRVQQLLAKYLAEAGLGSHSETSLQRAAKLGLVHLSRLLLDKQPDLLQELQSSSWTSGLTDAENEQMLNVRRFCYIELMHKAGDSSVIEEFCRQATDQPALDDCLGRRALVEGLAALLLNPYTGTPLTIGIYGEWGHGKSSLMQQVEVALCTIAIQQAFVRPLKCMSSITGKGKMVIGAVAKAVKELVGEDKIKKSMSADLELSDEAILEYFVDNYDPGHHDAYRSLALTDTSGLLEPLKHVADGESSTMDQRTDPVHQPRTPAVLTVWYNAWRYQDETEALAGLAVEIIKVMESTMNMALWMSMCWRYAWTRNRQEIYQSLFFPVALVGLLSVLLSVVLWNLPSGSSRLNIFKFSAPPVCFVVLLWTLSAKVYKTVQPVSQKLFSYFNPMQHESRLGYHHQVIADIKFMMTVLCSKPPSAIWQFLAKLKWVWAILGLEDHDYVAGTRIFKQAPGSDMRIIVLVDDLDRCNDGTILKVLSIINLVLSVCEINVILGIDTAMVHRALKNELFKETSDTESTEYVQKFLQKIVQLPITLPDPTNKRMGQFLARQMGFLHTNKKHNKVQGQKSSSLSTTETEEDDDDSEIEGEDDDLPDPNVDEQLNNTLVARYTAQECNIMVLLLGFTEHNKRLPREWKRFLNYHRFACNILSKNPAIETFPDWKIELLVWLFVCWQWMDLMDIITQRWTLIGEKVEREIASAKGGGAHEEGKGQSKDDNVVGEGEKERLSKNLEEILDESKGEDENREQKSLSNQESNYPPPTLRTFISTHQSEQTDETKKHHQSWQSILNLLNHYDTSMKGIQLFQEFRFNCKPGHLPWPIKGKEKDGDNRHMSRLMSSIQM